MKELFDSIVETAKTAEEAQASFILPTTGKLTVTENDYASGGHMLYGKKYEIDDALEKIVVTYESKDKCRTFQVRPDLNIVTVTWTKEGKEVEKFTNSWEDKF